MKLETKYKPKDKVWYISENKLHQTKIIGIHQVSYLPLKDKYIQNVRYQCDDGIIFNEKELFSTREELIKTL